MQRNEMVAIRDYKLEDKAFILATALRGLYYGDSWFSQIPKDVFMREYHTILERAIGAPGVIIKLAVMADDPEVIFGYVIYHPLEEGVSLDYIFVKSAFRGNGLARQLLPENIKSVSHVTKVGKALLPKIAPAFFNPFA